MNKKKVLGNDLLSHEITLEVPSALVGLTAVFGMGTGVSPPLWSPSTFCCHIQLWRDSRTGTQIAKNFQNASAGMVTV